MAQETRGPPSSTTSYLGTDLDGRCDLTEVLQKFRRAVHYETAKQMLIALQCCSLVGKENAVKAAENHRALRRKGITVSKTIDVLIATFCIDVLVKI
jgi:hypothetical protein